MAISKRFHVCEALTGVQQDLHRLLDCFFDMQDMAHVTLRGGLRATETENEIIVDFNLPEGIDPADVEVTLRARRLAITLPPDANASGGRARGRQYVLDLPCDVADSPQAASRGQSVRIRLPKRQTSRRIHIEKT